jgi:hypothetical protein
MKIMEIKQDYRAIGTYQASISYRHISRTTDSSFLLLIILLE